MKIIMSKVRSIRLTREKTPHIKFKPNNIMYNAVTEFFAKLLKFVPERRDTRIYSFLPSNQQSHPSFEYKCTTHTRCKEKCCLSFLWYIKMDGGVTPIFLK